MSIKGNQHKHKSNMLWADNVSTGDDVMNFIKKLFLLIQEEELLPTVGVVSVITKQKMLFGYWSGRNYQPFLYSYRMHLTSFPSLCVRMHVGSHMLLDVIHVEMCPEHKRMKKIYTLLIPLKKLVNPQKNSL